MKADASLDYAAFQLTPRKTRCEVVLSSGGETEREKVDAEGFVESLIVHLPAAKEKESANGFKIQLDENENEAPWFNKGTIERFILFASTPEVLERPNAIQAEIAQLETAKNFHLALYSQVDEDRLSRLASVKGASTPEAHIKLRTGTVVADASRSELLRALDVRLMTLHQELDRAISCATAAGFSTEHVADLLTFSERFQASCIRDACIKFLVLCDQRQQPDSIQINSEDACFSGFDMSLDNEKSSEALFESSRKQDDKPNENAVKENQVSMSYTTPHEQGCFSPLLLMDNAIVRPSMSTMEGEGTLFSPESDKMASGQFHLPALDDNKESQAPTRRSLVRSSSPRTRRSASPMRRVQIGKCGPRRSNASVIRSINYIPQWSSKERDSNRETESSDTDNESDQDNEESEPPPKIESSRIFSVQDAITLFERKQKEQRHSTEGPKKCIKVETRRLSAETGNSTTYEKSVLRRWSGASEMCKSDMVNSKMHSFSIGRETSQLEATPQSEFNPMEEPKDKASRFSSPCRIVESQNMHVEQVQRTNSECSEANRSAENYRGNNIIAANVVQRQGPTTTDSFSNSVDPGYIPMVKQLRSSHEMNQLLQEKANELEALFAAHTIRSKASEECSTASPPVKFVAKDKESILLKSSGLNSEGPSTRDNLYAGNPEEVNHKTDIFLGTEPELEQLLKTMPNIGRESLSNSCNTRTDFNMQTLMDIVDGNCFFNYEEQLGILDKNKISDEIRGKLYDQYREKREAKLREEHAAKKAEKEAKLKAMQETLERRKAEMARKSAKSSEKSDSLGQSQGGQQKLQSSRARLSKNKKELHKTNEDEGNHFNGSHEQSSHKKSTMIRGAPGEIPSPTSTPRLPTDLLKSNCVRTVSSKSTSSAIARSPVPLTSSSPRSTIPKISSTSTTSAGRRKNQSPVGGNPLARSMPNLNDLKKENTKVLSGQSSSNSKHEKGGATYHGQNKGSRCSKRGIEASHVDVNGSRAGLQSSHRKEEKNRSQPRKGIVGAKEIKSLSAINSEESALTLKPSFRSKVTKKSTVVPLESKPFLRKGSGNGPGTGRGISKTKALQLDDIPKTADDEVGKQNREEEVTDLEQSNITEAAEEDNKIDQAANDAVETVDAHVDLDTSEQNIQSMLALNKIEDISENCSCQNDISDKDKNMADLSEVVSNANVSPSKTTSSLSENEGHNDETALSSEIIMNEKDVKASSAALSLDVPPPSIDTASVHFIPSGLHSELVNPALSKLHKPNSLSQMLAADTDAEQTHKQWGNAQKPILVPQHPQKNAPKGLKRLLKFGRKCRSETVTMDSVSASTLSEGDDDTMELNEPFRRNANDALQGGQVQPKDIRPGNPSSNRSYAFQSSNSSVQSNQSAILRDQHLMGTTLLKAPRSFFSLSSFRSKGSDSKSR